MPSFVHVVESDYKPTFRTESVASMFDVSVEKKLSKKWSVDLPIEQQDWQIGLIVGPSGSGKSVISKKIFGDSVHKEFSWNEKSILDNFPNHLTVSEITEMLSRVGFSSPPQWMLSFDRLSNGQKFRTELARSFFEYKDLFVMDEFSSVVDRQVAKFGSFAFQKAIRQNKQKKFVAVTCHYDVEEWLQPDWVYDVSTNIFNRRSLRRPDISLEIFRTNYKTWEIFKDHHYLSSSINKSAFCYVGCIDDVPVVFDAWLPFFGKTSGGKKAMRGHRTVCLPDYQGLGLGNAIFTTLSRMWYTLGYDVFSCTGHPAEIKKRVKSKDWKITAQGRVTPDSNRKIKRSTDRLVSRFKYIGDKMDFTDAISLRGS